MNVKLYLNKIEREILQSLREKDYNTLQNNKQSLLGLEIFRAKIRYIPELSKKDIKIETNPWTDKNLLESLREQVLNKSVDKPLGISVTYKLPIKDNLDDFGNIVKCLQLPFPLQIIDREVNLKYTSEGQSNNEEILQGIKARAKKDLETIFDRIEQYKVLVDEHNANLEQYVSNIYNSVLSEKKVKKDLEDKLNPF